MPPTCEATEHVEAFDVDGSGYAEETFTHDAAGNLTYDGVYQYAYDAWGRMTSIAKAYRDATGAIQAGSIVAENEYDGQGRRTVKRVMNSPGLDVTLLYFHDGQRIAETRTPFLTQYGYALQQYVWGLTYVDELIQVGNIDWYGEGIQSRHWAATDANYNVLGVIDYWGSLVERYEYTPYGQRQVFRSAGSIVSDDYVSSEIGYQTRYFSGANDPGLHAPTHLGRRAYGFDLGRMPVGLCEVGHQGLLHDEHVGLVYNRARHLHPKLGRFMQRDPMEYVDGGSLYTYLRSSSLRFLDPYGGQTTQLTPRSGGRNHFKEEEIKWTPVPGGWEDWNYARNDVVHYSGTASGVHWYVDASVDYAYETCPDGCAKVDAGGRFWGEVKYDPNSPGTKEHEATHVSHKRTAYNNSKRKSLKIEGFGCMPDDAATCYRDFINRYLVPANEAWEYYKLLEFHCENGPSEYGGASKEQQDRACAGIKDALKELRRLEREGQKFVDECARKRKK